MRLAGMLSPGLALCLGLAVATAAPAQDGDDTLEIYVVDVEGGEATLFVAPSGESLLVDTGWPGFDGRDADRIAAAAADAGVTGIDRLIVTHFHGDHMGGALQLAERLPVRTFIDHGTTVDEDERPLAAFAQYADLRESAEHVVAAPGDPVPMDGLDVRIIASGGAELDAPLPGAGGANPFCDGFTFHGEDITSRYGNAEDDQSVSTFVGFGRFRTVIMGDLNWNREHALMCPDNRVGVVDLYLVSHHGSETSGSEALAHAIAPRAAVMNNGPRKGGAGPDVRDPPRGAGAAGHLAEPLRHPRRRRQCARGVHRQPGRGRRDARRPDRAHGCLALDSDLGSAGRVVHGHQQPQRLQPGLPGAAVGVCVVDRRVARRSKPRTTITGRPLRKLRPALGGAPTPERDEGARLALLCSRRPLAQGR